MIKGENGYAHSVIWMTGIRAGDRVIVKYPNHSPWEATVVSTNPQSFDYKVSYNKDYSEVYEGQPDTVLDRYVSRYPPDCNYCKNRKIYHDRQEDWICPFCDMR